MDSDGRGHFRQPEVRWLVERDLESLEDEAAQNTSRRECSLVDHRILDFVHVESENISGVVFEH